MPVRTDRGRAAVYRKLWGWPLRSPRHLATTVGAVAVLGAGVTMASAAVRPDPPQAAATSSTSTTTMTTTSPTAPPSWPGGTSGEPAPSTTSTTTGRPTSTPPTGTPTAGTNVASPTDHAVVAAREFMARWVTHPAGMTSQQWAAQLAPFVVPESRVMLESVDPTNIPATQVTGDPAVTAETTSVVEANVATDGGTVHLVLLLQRDRTWLVRSWDLAA